MNNEDYWNYRAQFYDKLNWVYDKPWLLELISFSEVDKNDKILDVGCGTGIVSKGLVEGCALTVAMDISDVMLDQINDDRICKSLASIEDNYIMTDFFDKIISRMCFHHLERIDAGFHNCFKMLKPRGQLIITEAVPPADDLKVVQWWTEMFALKEKRRVFTLSILKDYFRKHGFVDIKFKVVITKQFDIMNWISHQGLLDNVKNAIIGMHYTAPDYVKKAHKMEFVDNKILLDSKNIIIKGRKK